MTSRCDCCHGDLEEDQPEACLSCENTLHAIQCLAPSYKLHILAAALDHSAKDIAHRTGCSAGAHNPALGNATRKTGISRGDLIRVAKWGLRTGRLDKPEGFDDLSPNNGPEPIQAHGKSFSTGASVAAGPSAREKDAAQKREARAEAREQDEAPEPPVVTPDCTEPDGPRLEAEYYRGLCHGLLRGIEALERVR